jgi:2',3'-cyclic-nucleotide 2'-phosphodiesterase (5'-nucleotidase family)
MKNSWDSPIIPSIWLWIIIIVLFSVGPLVLTRIASLGQDAKLEVDLLQVNDVYEIAGLNNGSVGGMARVATLKKRLRRENSNVLLLLAGDFISPSVFNNVRQAGTAVAGKQMIESMDAAGVDLVVFGNHEFDFSYHVLQQRIDESNFQWLASNVAHVTASGPQPFQQQHVDIPTTWTKKFTSGDGYSVTIGFFGLTISDNRGDSNYAVYTPTLEAARKMYKALAASCDAVIAVTHQNMADDEMLADSLPGLAAIIGGHEHDGRFEKRGSVYITKAHANAKTAYELKIFFDKNEKRPAVYPVLIPIDSSLAADPSTAAVVDKWTDIARNYFKASQINVDSPVCPGLATSLDGRDQSVRFGPTNLSQIITGAMLWGTRQYHTQLALLNAGSIRVDDIIVPPVMEYSFVRALPYGGAIQVARFKGYFLKTVLDAGAKLTGEGGFLQVSANVHRDTATRQWEIDNKVIGDSIDYVIAIADYLIKGKQKGLAFIREHQPGVDSVYPAPLGSEIRSDIVKTTIASLRSKCPSH